MLDLKAYIFVSLALFAVGIYAVLSKRNTIMMLIGVEFMTNAGILNFVAFSKYDTDNDGQLMALFIIVMAAVGVAVALAIMINVFKHYKSIDPNKLTNMKN